jgi:transmembrane sensor
MGAIAATLLGVVVLWVLSSAASGTYATARGEQRALKLDDGSVIYLNTESRVEVHLSSTERSVRLRAGEALFRVAHDAHRPFRVIADDAVIQAIGTEFNVYRATGGTTVSVVEGVVQIMHSAAAAASPTRAAGPTPLVSASQITAGEQARVSAAGAIVKQTHADLQRAVAWRERRLVFRGDTLEDVAREFNRYNTLQIQIEDASVRDRRLTATFDADDPQSLVLFLQKSGDLRVDEHGQVVSIYSN